MKFLRKHYKGIFAGVQALGTALIAAVAVWGALATAFPEALVEQLRSEVKVVRDRLLELRQERRALNDSIAILRSLRDSLEESLSDRERRLDEYFGNNYDRVVVNVFGTVQQDLSSLRTKARKAAEFDEYRKWYAEGVRIQNRLEDSIPTVKRADELARLREKRDSLQTVLARARKKARKMADEMSRREGVEQSSRRALLMSEKASVFDTITTLERKIRHRRMSVQMEFTGWLSRQPSSWGGGVDALITRSNRQLQEDEENGKGDVSPMTRFRRKIEAFRDTVTGPSEEATTGLDLVEQALQAQKFQLLLPDDQARLRNRIRRLIAPHQEILTQPLQVRGLDEWNKDKAIAKGKEVLARIDSVRQMMSSLKLELVE